jgi:hypothetical protein
MPCKRCHHLRRSCEFNVRPAREERREPHLDGSVEELKDRSTYMERILRHHFPDLSLEIEALRHTCESLPSRRDFVDQDDTCIGLPGTVPSAPASDSPDIEDENCTIDYVDDTTVRTWPLDLEMSTSQADIKLLLRCRLLWRIFALELFHAHQAQH